jgi:hypothetical protein
MKVSKIGSPVSTNLFSKGRRKLGLERRKAIGSYNQGHLKFKAFSNDPALLAELTEILRKAYSPRRCIVSSVQRATDGDLMLFVQVFEEVT